MKMPKSEGEVNGYSDAGQARKDKFLRDAKKFLRQVGKELAQKGFSEVNVSANPAGIACAGDASGYYYKPGSQISLYLTIGADILQPGLSFMARWNNSHGRSGPNNWINADKDSVEVAAILTSIHQNGEAVKGASATTPVEFHR
jgi:hypothetical protein